MFQLRLNELRERAGYTSQQAFANAFGVAQSTVAGWESGAREPKYSTTVRLAQFFDVTVGYLMGTEDYDLIKISTGPWTKDFLDNLLKEFSNANAADLEAACIDTQQLDQLLNGDVPVTLETACEMADFFTGSLDQLVGMENGRCAGETKKSPSTAEAVPGDDVDEEIKNLLPGLSQEQKRVVLALLRALVAEGPEALLSAQDSEAAPTAKSPNQ